MGADTQPTVWFNGRCSTCRRLRDLLEERGVAAHYRHYLDDPPSREELGRVLVLTGSEDPAVLLRAKDPLAAELGLPAAGRDAVLDALAAHPQLIQRPVVILPDRAVVARPPETVLEVLPPA
jgi:arsenate reductase (glutaredoxin)